MDTRSKLYARTPFAPSDEASASNESATQETASVEAPPEGVLVVDLAKDGPYAITSTDSISAGDDIEIRVKNNAALIHNLRILRTDLAADSLPTNDQAMVDEDSVGEILYASEDLQNGAEGTGEIALSPGSYVLFCNIPGHYQLRMYKTINVE